MELKMANWLTLDKICEWEGALFPGFQYDSITDEEITNALSDDYIAKVDPNLDWENDSELYLNESIPEEFKHVYRVAALVRDFKKGNLMRYSIELDTYTMYNCRSCIPNGHHRIRALQYLGLLSAPFGLCGDVDLLEELVAIAGTECPSEARLYVEAPLLVKEPDDIS
jgi:hypothetical protein